MGIQMVTATVLGAEELAPDQPVELEPRVMHIMNATHFVTRLFQEDNLDHIVVWRCDDKQIVIAEGVRGGKLDSYTLTADGRTGAADMAELVMIVTTYALAYHQQYPVPFKNFIDGQWRTPSADE